MSTLYRVLVSFEYVALGDGKRLAERILAVVNESTQETGDE
jgi:hypothetical protein